MSQAGRFSGGGPTPPGTAIQTITGDTGGPVGPTAGNVNLFTDNTTVQFDGNPGTSTITQDFGLSNLILGSNAVGITVGLQNVGLGEDALNSLTSGLSNTAIGYQALLSVTTGSSNIAIGQSSLDANIAGVRNIGIGTDSLGSLTGGDDNTALGESSLELLVSGDRNIAIGQGAGSNYNGGESDNILIGVAGIVGDNAVIRIGTSPVITDTFIAGIYNEAVGATNAAVFIDNTGKLGTVGGSPSPDLLSYTNVNTSPYVVTATDEYLGVDVSVAPITLQFPDAPSTGRVFIVKDFGGFAATNNITLTSVGGAIGFDGALSYVMNTNFQSVQLLFDGTNYQLF